MLHEQLRRIGLPCDEIAPAYASFFTDERLKQLADIAQKLQKTDFFPRAERVLRFAQVDPSTLRCVIVGMDPYPSHTVNTKGEIIPEATGRSFEVASVTDWGGKYRQASLRNILKSIYYLKYRKVPTMEMLREELANGSFPILPPQQWWDSLERQGVLFLNASLTVVPAHPGTHADLWDAFMTDLMSFIAQKAPHAVWLLWGNVAQNRVPQDVTNRICSQHPRLPVFVTECPFASLPDICWLGK
jgi:uracil-DNA glycosylase